MTDEATIKAGDHLGEINGKPVTAKADGSADVEQPKAASEMTLDEHHAALVKREIVTLTLPPRSNPLTGYRRGAIEKDVVLNSARCAVAHRVLHGCSPKERAALEKAHAASDDAKGDFEKWALRHIEQNLPAELVGPALQKTLAIHAEPKKLVEHRARAMKALEQKKPAPAPASANAQA